jgi:hypothetical protein
MFNDKERQGSGTSTVYSVSISNSTKPASFLIYSCFLRDVDTIKKFSDVLVLDLNTLLDESGCEIRKAKLAGFNNKYWFSKLT